MPNSAADLTANRASRLLIDRTVDLDPNMWLSRQVIRTLLRTYGTAIEETSATIMACLSESRLRTHGYVFLHDLADGLPEIVKHDLEIARQLYRTVFSFQPQDSDPIAFGTSSFVLRLTTSPGQAVSSAKYLLAKHFRYFLEGDPVTAIPLFCDVLELDARGGVEAREFVNSCQTYIDGLICQQEYDAAAKLLRQLREIGQWEKGFNMLIRLSGKVERNTGLLSFDYFEHAENLISERTTTEAFLHYVDDIDELLTEEQRRSLFLLAERHFESGRGDAETLTTWLTKRGYEVQRRVSPVEEIASSIDQEVRCLQNMSRTDLSNLSSEEVDEICSAVYRLSSTLPDRGAATAARRALIGTCYQLSRLDEIPSRRFRLPIRELLVKAAELNKASSEIRTDEREEAALAFFNLSRFSEMVDQEFVDVFTVLVEDKSHRIRELAYDWLIPLYEVSRGLFNRFLGQGLRNENHVSTLHALARTIRKLAPVQPDRTFRFQSKILEKIGSVGNRDARNVRGVCVWTFLELACVEQNEFARKAFEDVARHPDEWADELQFVLANLESVLAEALPVARASLLYFLKLIVDNCGVLISEVRNIGDAVGWTEVESEPADLYRNAETVVESVAMSISNAFEVLNERQDTQKLDLLFEELAPLMGSLSVLGLPGLSYQLLDDLFVPSLKSNPSFAFEWGARFVISASQHGFQADRLAFDKTAAFVREVMADFGNLFSGDNENSVLLTDLIETMMDWPDAFELAIELESIVR